MAQKTAPKIGRPASPFPARTPVRHNDDQIARWRISAARAGLSLQDWMRLALDGESKHPTHIKPLGARRG